MLNLSRIKPFLFASLVVVFVSGCKKDKEESNQGGGTNTPTDFSPLTAGSSWTYLSDDGSSYTLTASGKDTTALSRTYKVLSNNNGPNYYKTKSGSDYYQFVVIPELGANGIELLYLKEDQAVNATWQTSQVLNVPNIPIPLTATFKYTIKEKGVTRTVKSKAYPDVTHIRLDVTVTGLGSLGGGDFYCAKGVGIIEGTMVITYNGQEVVNQTDLLTAYTIK